MTWVDPTTPEDGLADLLNQACRDRFGEAVTFTPQSTGVPESITAAFQREPEDRTLASMNIEHVTTDPIIDLRLADCSVSPERGDSFVARGVTYNVIKVHDDSAGWAEVYLQQVS